MPNPTGKNTRPPKPANPEIDAGLDRLAETLPNGATLTASEIAAAVGCTAGYIRNVERFALAKIKREIEKRIAAGEFQLTGRTPDRRFSARVPAGVLRETVYEF